MHQELKAFVINMKSLDQDIDDPIIAGAGDANGRSLRIIFTQEAKAMMTPLTKVYLKWRHQELDIRGYNIFKKISDSPLVWEIYYPQAMLHEGNVLCRIEIVDDISISPSVNFIVHVLSDPDDGSKFVLSDDYTIFQNCVIELNSLSEEMREKLDEQEKEFEEMMGEYSELRKKVDDAYDKAQEALDKIDEMSSNIIASEVYMTEF